MRKKIINAEAAGFIGYHLCGKLLSEGYHIIGIDNVNDYYNIGPKYTHLNNLGIQKEESSIFNKLKKQYGYNPDYSIEQGIRSFVKWYKDYKHYD